LIFNPAIKNHPSHCELFVVPSNWEEVLSHSLRCNYAVYRIKRGFRAGGFQKTGGIEWACTKKTGLNDQGMIKKPGEFSNLVQM